MLVLIKSCIDLYFFSIYIRIPDLDQESYSQYGQDKWLDTVLFKGMLGGFFIEAGADDFVLDSNSLLLELQHGWTGLLVEADPGRGKTLGFMANR